MASIIVQIRDQIDTAVNEAKRVAEIAAAAEKSAEGGIAALKTAAENSSKPVIGKASASLRAAKTKYNKATQLVEGGVKEAQRWAQNL